MKRFFPLAALILGLVAIVAALIPKGNRSEFDVAAFGRLPLLLHGRIQPYDHVARTTLLIIQGRQAVYTPQGVELQPIEWLLDVFFKPDLADRYQVFLVNNPDVLTIFNLKPEDGLGKKRFSYSQFVGQFAEIERQAGLAEQVEKLNRSPFQGAALQLRNNLVMYQLLQHALALPRADDYLGQLLGFEKDFPELSAAVKAQAAGKPFDEAALKKLVEIGGNFLEMQKYGYLLSVPPDPSESADDWKTTGNALVEALPRGSAPAAALVFAGLAQTWQEGRAKPFNELVGRYRSSLLASRFPSELGKVEVETRFDSAQPFYVGMWLYGFAFLFGVLAWLMWPDTFGRSAFNLLTLAWVVTTAGICVRMWLEGRPPVTNLYSSALFIGWGSVGLCLVLEAAFRNAIASVAGGLTGLCTLLIAHYLSLDGDTLEMMRAVLDSNFWLATHVVIVTTGYASTFLAGFLALIYVFRGLFTRSLDSATATALTKMVYGIICFATLFSLVGTVLGGIWADQSWGRFWGWDPKENGALIIVIWNAIILHCRWGGMIKARGLMCLAIGGNIVTSWSWFGVNMLGVGLHSYGFTGAAFVWLSGFVLSQLAIIAIANLPLEKWRSFQVRSSSSA